MIRKILQSVLCICLSPLLVAQQTAATSTTVRLLKGTDIHLKLDQDLSSATVHKGDNVRYVVVDDVNVGGMVAIPAGTAVYRKVAIAQPSSHGVSCGKGNNGWFNLEDPVLRSSDRGRMRLTTLPPGYFQMEPMSHHDKLLMVLAAPLQIPAIAILVAAPIVLIPYGIASGIHDKLHHPMQDLQVPERAAGAQALPVIEPPLPTTVRPTTESEPAIALPLPDLQLPQRPIALLPLQSPATESPQGMTRTAPCAAPHEMKWKANEAKVETYYLVRSYTVRASLTRASPGPGPAKLDQ